MSDLKKSFDFKKPQQKTSAKADVEQEVLYFFNNDLKFQNIWIKGGADDAMIKFAEDAGKYMARNGLANNQIRRIFDEIKRIQMKGFEKEKAYFLLLRPKVAYAYAKEKKKNINKGFYLFKLVFDKAAVEVNNENHYRNFCNYIEAILAYHKANGGKD